MSNQDSFSNLINIKSFHIIDFSLIALCASHIGDIERLNHLKEMIRSYVNQDVKIQFFISISCEESMLEQLSKEIGEWNQIYGLHILMQSVKKSQFQHYKHLVDHLVSSKISLSTWIIFSDDDDTWHPFRVKGYLNITRQLKNTFKDNHCIRVTASHDEKFGEYFEYSIRLKTSVWFFDRAGQELLASSFCKLFFLRYMVSFNSTSLCQLPNRPYQRNTREVAVGHEISIFFVGVDPDNNRQILEAQVKRDTILMLAGNFKHFIPTYDELKIFLNVSQSDSEGMYPIFFNPGLESASRACSRSNSLFIKTIQHRFKVIREDLQPIRTTGYLSIISQNFKIALMGNNCIRISSNPDERIGEYIEYSIQLKTSLPYFDSADPELLASNFCDVFFLRYMVSFKSTWLCNVPTTLYHYNLRDGTARHSVIKGVDPNNYLQVCEAQVKRDTILMLARNWKRIHPTYDELKKFIQVSQVEESTQFSFIQKWRLNFYSI
ncbi:hypothetical protein PPL_11355 [Heterostelium album PN500]|uniref:Uncharacterized protein n=1 Tax=Heterostelium pallidum (strain ATCC 26659 / Pp 5 / PN500) TaxID=670386 RepID=D3BT63_HETP5|nr:hypothetical protein PPL_11355 [Heterostelium album PN500]EFA75280.1 hypothetical protein PPL_11355 [Heterostelium album PN500]|eukprot:XP_020427414.1 hypothetical protein PPL_11355 [Heterostelium album PN500]